MSPVHEFMSTGPTVFRLYEQNMGPLTPLIADRLIKALETYPTEWIEEALGEAVAYNRRSWRYVARILENWVSGRTIRQDRQTMRPLKEILPKLANMADGSSEIYRPLDVPVCPKCKGAGWLRLDVPLGHPSFGRLFKCECITTAEDRAHTSEMRRLSQLDGLENKSFANFEATTAELEKALASPRHSPKRLTAGSC